VFISILSLAIWFLLKHTTSNEVIAAKVDADTAHMVSRKSKRVYFNTVCCIIEIYFLNHA